MIFAKAASQAARASRQRISRDYSSLPLSFEQNQGQAESRIRFLSRGANYSILLKENEADLLLSTTDRLRMRFLSAHADSFTFRNIRAVSTAPQSSSTCSGPNQYYFPSNVGAGVFRFEDGSLLKVNLTQGADCIDLAAQEAHCTLSFQITGGTGRFKDASGVLSFAETVVPVLADATHNPVFFAATGEFTGTISGVTRRLDRHEEGQEERQ
jgi:hypothetical protein